MLVNCILIKNKYYPLSGKGDEYFISLFPNIENSLISMYYNQVSFNLQNS